MKNLQNDQIEKKAAVFTSVGFVMLLICILCLCVFTKDQEVSFNENRTLAQTPQWELSAVINGKYMEDFETYASDQVAGRDAWVRMKNSIDIISGKKDNGNAFFGKEGYLFPIEKISQDQLAKNLQLTKNFIEKRKEEDSQLKVSVLLAPTSTEIMKDKLPQYAPVIDEAELLQQAEEVLGQTLINPEKILSEHKDQYLYYRTDHHWTTLGAYYAYRIWAERSHLKPVEQETFQVEIINSQFYGTTASKAAGIKRGPDSIEKFSNKSIEDTVTTVITKERNRKMEGMFDESYLAEKDKYSYFLGGNNPLTIIETETHNKKNILVLKDSYANCFVPFLAMHFEKIVVVDLRYFKEPVSMLMEKEAITDLLFLYNIIQFSNDRNFAYLK